MRLSRGAAWRGPAYIWIFVFLWLSATAWMRPLMVPDEGRYVGIAWEMMRSGDWLTPTLDGLPFFHKPPLFYWITAGAMSVFGMHEWAARVAPLLGATLGACALYVFMRRWVGDRAALLTLVALLAQPLFYLGGQFANLDMLVAGCITATIVLAAHAALSIDRKLHYRLALACAYVMAALGVLAKGLIGIVIPGLVVLVWLIAQRRWRVLRTLLWWPGLLLFMLAAAPWFVAMQLRFPDFLHYFFVVQHFQRFAAGGFNNVQPFWFYPVLLLVFSLPWLPWLHRLFTSAASADGAQREVRLLMLLWAGLVVLFFSMPQSKLVGYVLPAVPPLAALMAEGFAQVAAPSKRMKRWWLASAAAASVVGLATVIVLTIGPPHSLRELALVLGARHGPNEPVFMLGQYYYDVPFYARLTSANPVVDDWQSDQVQTRDNWRKELADADHFAKPGGPRALVLPAALPAAICASPVSWVIGPVSAVTTYPFLQSASVVSSASDIRLWRVESSVGAVFSALRCEETPNAGSEGR